MGDFNKMNLGIDCTFYKNNNTDTGLGIFIKQIIFGIADNLDKKNVTLFVRDSFYEESKKIFKEFNIVSIKTIKIPKIEKIFLQLYLLKKVIKKYKIDLFINPYVAVGQLIYSPCKNLVVLHDLHFKHYPEVYNMLYRIIMKIWIGLIIKNATKIVAISNYTKNDIIDTYKIQSEKIVVIGNPVEVDFNIKTKKVISSKYILSVNSFAPWKNQITLIKAFIEIKDKIEQKLVLIGYRNSNELQNFINNNNLKYDVFIKQDLTNDELYWYYQNADLFVNTSMFEGFGRGNIEAGLFKLPIITTEEMCLKECSFGLLEYYKPATDSHILADKILKCLKENVYPRERLENIRNTFLDKYNKSYIGKLYLNIINDLIR